MGVTKRQAFAGYRDGVTGLTEVREPVGAVEDARAAPRQLVLSMRDPGEQLRGARRHPAALA
jgi:hypothetical protein